MRNHSGEKQSIVGKFYVQKPWKVMENSGDFEIYENLSNCKSKNRYYSLLVSKCDEVRLYVP